MNLHAKNQRESSMFADGLPTVCKPLVEVCESHYYKSSKVPSVVHFEKEKDADNLKQHGESGTSSS